MADGRRIQSTGSLLRGLQTPGQASWSGEMSWEFGRRSETASIAELARARLTRLPCVLIYGTPPVKELITGGSTY